MIKYIKEHLFSVAAIIPAVLIAFGMLIINNNLSNYGLIDYTLIQGHTIFVGFTFISVVVIYAIYWFLFLELHSLEKNNFLYILINAVIKPICITPIICLFLIQYSEIPSLQIFKWNINGFRIFSISIGLTFSGLLIFINNNDFIKNGIKNDLLGRLSFIVGIVLISLSLVPSIYLILKVKEFRDCFNFFAGYSFFIFVLFTTIVSHMKDHKNGVVENPSFSLFSNTNSSMKLDNIYIVSYFLVMTLILVTNYSNHLYPNLYRKFGGHISPEYNIELEDKNIIGTIIHQNENMIYIKDSNNKVNPISWDNIESLNTIEKLEKNKTN